MQEKSLLHEAIKALDLKAVESLIQDKADIDKVIDGLSPLELAAVQYDPKGLDIVNLLLKSGAKLEIDGQSALLLAVQVGNKEAVVKLIEAKAKVNPEFNPPLALALVQQDREIVSILLKEKAICDPAIIAFSIQAKQGRCLVTAEEKIAKQRFDLRGIRRKGGVYINIPISSQQRWQTVDILLEHKVAIPVSAERFGKAINNGDALEVQALLRAKATLQFAPGDEHFLEEKPLSPPLIQAMENHFGKPNEIINVLLAAKADSKAIKDWDPAVSMVYSPVGNLFQALKMLPDWAQPTEIHWQEAISKAALTSQNPSKLQELYKTKKIPLAWTQSLLKEAQEQPELRQGIIEFLKKQQDQAKVFLSVFYKKQKSAIPVPELREAKKGAALTLHQAVINLDLDALETLIASKADVNEGIFYDHTTALHYVADSAHPKALSIIEALLKAKADPSLRPGYQDSLQIAASLGRVQACQAILRSCQDRAMIERALNAAIWSHHINHYTKHHTQIVALLLEHQAVPTEYLVKKAAKYNPQALELLLNAKAETKGLGLVYDSVHERNENLLGILIAAKADIEEGSPSLLHKYNMFTSPLLSAVSGGNRAAVKLLLNAKANIRVKDNYGDGVIYMALSCDEIDLDICTMLLEAKADLAQVDKLGRTAVQSIFLGRPNVSKVVDLMPFFSLLGEEASNFRKSALEFAKQARCHRSVIEFLQHPPQMRMNPLLVEEDMAAPFSSAPSKRLSPQEVLRKAVLSGELEQVEVLLAQDKVKPDTGMLKELISSGNIKMLALLGAKADSKGLDLFRQAIVLGDIKSLETLIKAKINIETPDREGLTPLLFAVKDCFRQGVELLLQAKADSTATDKNQNTSLHLLINEGVPSISICSQLIAAKADIMAKNDQGYNFLEKAVLSSHPVPQMAVFISACVSALKDHPQGDDCRKLALQQAVKNQKTSIVDAITNQKLSFAPVLDESLNPLAALRHFSLFDKQCLRLVLGLADMAPATSSSGIENPQI